MHQKMANYYLIFLAFSAFILTPIVHAYSLKIEAKVGDIMEVILVFDNLDLLLYYETRENEVKVLENVKNSFEKSFNDRNLTATVWIDPLKFQDENTSIEIRVRLSGPMPISVSVDPKSLNRTYEVITVWRKFRLTIFKEFVVDLEERFKAPVYEWNVTKNVISLRLNNSSFAFVLPEDATKIEVDRREIITFMVPANFVDKLLNSPLVALMIIMLMPVIALAYRKMKILKEKFKR